jgi:hypothetical protein
MGGLVGRWRQIVEPHHAFTPHDGHFHEPGSGRSWRHVHGLGVVPEPCQNGRVKFHCERFPRASFSRSSRHSVRFVSLHRAPHFGKTITRFRSKKDRALVRRIMGGSRGLGAQHAWGAKLMATRRGRPQIAIRLPEEMLAQLAELAQLEDTERGCLARNETGAGVTRHVRRAIGQYLAGHHLAGRPPAA